MIKAQRMNEELKKIIARAESDPGSPATAGELAAVLKELDSVEAWANTSFRVLNQRLQLLKRKSDPVDPGIRQQLTEIEKKLKQTESIIQKLMYRS
jgi:hypothetical protein